MGGGAAEGTGTVVVAGASAGTAVAVVAALGRGLAKGLHVEVALVVGAGAMIGSGLLGGLAGDVVEEGGGLVVGRLGCLPGLGVLGPLELGVGGGEVKLGRGDDHLVLLGVLAHGLVLVLVLLGAVVQAAGVVLGAVPGAG